MAKVNIIKELRCPICKGMLKFSIPFGTWEELSCKKHNSIYRKINDGRYLTFAKCGKHQSIGEKIKDKILIRKIDEMMMRYG